MSHLEVLTPSPMTPPKTAPSTPDTPSPVKDLTTKQHDHQIQRNHKRDSSLLQRENGTGFSSDEALFAEETEEPLERRMARLDLAKFGRHPMDTKGRNRLSNNTHEFVSVRSKSADDSISMLQKEHALDRIEVNKSENKSNKNASPRACNTSECDEHSQSSPMDHPRQTASTTDDCTTISSTNARLRGEPLACLFVASLCSTRSDTQLFESNVEDAQRALVQAQNTIVDGRHIRIEQARVNRTLSILRFSRSTTEQDIRKCLEEYGPLEDVSILHDSGPSGSRRYALARFSYRDDAIKAFVTLRANSHWVVEWAPNTNTSSLLDRDAIFVGQLNPAQVTKEALQERFEPYGTIKGITLLNRGRQGTKGPIAYAFIEYSNESEATKAIENENNTEFQGHLISVQYRETSEYRLQRQFYLQQAHMAQSVPSVYYHTASSISPSRQPHSLQQPATNTAVDSNAAPLATEGHDDTAASACQVYAEQGIRASTTAHLVHPVYYGPPQIPIPNPYMTYHGPCGMPLYPLQGTKEERGSHSQISVGPTDFTQFSKQAKLPVSPQPLAPIHIARAHDPMNHVHFPADYGH
ncbi:hypothetical protein BGW42_006412 [Actinomortierella wolfii]|nr:hypothetical protein BGW42_006412 [Actinomortierella wolfii]